MYNFRVNLNEPSFDFVIHLPRLEFKGKYDLAIRVVLVDIAGKGDIIGILGEDSLIFFQLPLNLHFFFIFRRGFQGASEATSQKISEERQDLYDFWKDFN